MTSPIGACETLHQSESGICEQRINGGVMAYTGQLARYIRCPSTIRTRVLEQFDRAPSIEDIRAIQARSLAPRDKFRDAWEALGEHDHDAAPFRVQGFVPMRKKRAIPVPKDDGDFEDCGAPALPACPPALHGDLITAIAAEFGLTADDIVSKRRWARFMPARMTAAYVFHKRGNSYPQIGRWLGGRDHSTVLNLVRRFEKKATPGMRELAACFIEVRA